MADGIRFDGRVAVVTGAGRGLGRSHALELARRGASVVVNDLDDGDDVAGRVVAEIEAAGGRAVAYPADASSIDGGRAIVDAALRTYGGVDLVVHNAGVAPRTPFPTADLEAVRTTLETSLLAAWYVAQPAWHAMAERGYGRFVLTGSGAAFGHAELSAYSAAKAGLIGLARSMALAAQAASLDILTNVVAPIAATRMVPPGRVGHWQGRAVPEAVSPVVAYLLSERATANGEVVHAVAGHVCRIVLGATHGRVFGDAILTAEDVAAAAEEVMGTEQVWWPRSSTQANDHIRKQLFAEATTPARTEHHP